jgi:hypothetical protein
LTLQGTSVELPLLVGKSIMLEVALIYADDNYILLDELPHESTDPKPPLIIVSVSILGVGFIQLLELQIELRSHDFS